MQDLSAPYFDLDTAPLSVDHVTLDVCNLDRVAAFYRDVIGLVTHSTSSASVTLGSLSPFLTLRARPQAAPLDPHAPGLFHTAFLLPLRSDLGNWLRHLADLGVPLYGASDHNVSEAIYLNDPEGNGIEVYADTPVAQWTNAQGRLEMPSRHLNLQAIPHAGKWRGAPEGTRIGHVHLQTTDIRAAEPFWTSIGLDVTARYPGGSFFGAGGYHHQIATNTWASGGRPAKDPRTAGLAGITMLSSLHNRTQTLTAPSGVTLTLLPKGH